MAAMAGISNSTNRYQISAIHRKALAYVAAPSADDQDWARDSTFDFLKDYVPTDAGPISLSPSTRKFLWPGLIRWPLTQSAQRLTILSLHL